jgi:hypothetical protein
MVSYVEGGRSREAYNERVKLVSQTLQNLGVALTVALVGTVYVEGLSPIIAIGALIAISLFVTAFKVLGNLEGEVE